ncbi:hypothetical protein [Actinospongicola halichondriae]|uniref:hypothetical protein n=1 Tax=Actinospongicola halichondriae TaxID=3236844 RepID=UPI003D539242
MDDDSAVGIQRRDRSLLLVGAAIGAAALIVVLLLADRSDDDAAPPPTTTSETSTTTISTGVRGDDLDVMGIATIDDRTFVFGTRDAGVMGATAAPGLDLGFATPALAVGSDLVLLDPSGAVLVGREGGDFTTVGCCFVDLLTSGEPDAFWAIGEDDHAEMIDVADGATGRRIALDGQQVVGSVDVGLVMADADGRTLWRRPAKGDMAIDVAIDVDADETVVAAGGDVIAVHDRRSATLEIRAVRDDRPRAVLDLDGSDDVDVVLSAAGDAVAITVGDSTTVFDARTAAPLGSIVGAERVVSIGGRRFAGIVDGEIVASDDARRDLAASARVVATRAE